MVTSAGALALHVLFGCYCHHVTIAFYAAFRLLHIASTHVRIYLFRKKPNGRTATRL